VLGAIETDMAYVDRDFEAIRKDFIAAYPLKRLGQPAEVAAAAIFLTKATWITGACLTLDGGLSVS
jgi:3-oxoacyl-[acyl-carrier protein] reductase